MTTPTEAVYTVLSNFAGLQALIGTRIYSILMPQDSTKPAITFLRVSDERVQTMTDAGGNGVVRDRMRFNIYADTLGECETIAVQIRLALMAATTFEALHIFETDNFEPDTLLYSVVSDYSIWYKY